MQNILIDTENKRIDEQNKKGDNLNSSSSLRELVVY